MLNYETFINKHIKIMLQKNIKKANQNHSEIPPHIHQDGYKDKEKGKIANVGNDIEKLNPHTLLCK